MLRFVCGEDIRSDLIKSLVSKVVDWMKEFEL